MLIFAAILVGQIACVFGAVIGGAAGNTITDGIGGLFEGHIAEKQKTLPITAISSSLGKMAGCLFGAGAGLLLVYFISLF